MICELIAAANHIDIHATEALAIEHNPGILMVTRTPHF